jgi:uncharacterized membrane protein YjjB (DUF3815 family)
MTDRSPKMASTEEAAHLSLQLGRLLLVNGAETAQVQTAVETFAAGMGCEAHLLVSFEALLLTVISGGDFRTKVGLHVVGMTVDMTAVQALNQIAADTACGRVDVAEARARLAAVESGRPLHSHWLVACALGLTAASLSWLFGGDGSIFVTAFIAGTCAILVQQQLRRLHVHPLATTFLSALAGGVVGGLGMRLYPGVAPALCLIAPGMILVPGVPLINSIHDAIDNNMSLSLARLAWALLVVTAIAFGLCTATLLTGIAIPTSGATPLLPIAQDALFSALATIGYVFLFNVTWRVSWACVICGLCSHSLRTALMHLGIDVVSGTMVASLAVGVLAYVFARGFRAPPTTFAFPGVVAMIPGSYAFRAVVASLLIMNSADASSASLLAQALSLIISTVLLTGAIAIGLAIPLSLHLIQPPDNNQGRSKRGAIWQDL